MALLTLAEARTALNITQSTFDAELQDYIDGAIAAVEFICGPAESTEATDVVHGCGVLALNHTPVLTLVSVTGDVFGARDITQLRVNADSGVVRQKRTFVPLLLEDWYTVVYTYGRTTTPPAMKQAAKAILRFNWSTQRGSGPRQRSDETTFVPGLGYVYSEALIMLAPYDRGPAVG